MISFTPEEIEETRLESLSEIEAERLEQNVPGSFGYHEALDRSSLILNNLDDYLMDHPAILADPEAYRLASDAHTMIFNLYQHLGAKHLVEDEPQQPE